MDITRALYYNKPIELTETSRISLGVTFKQYDIGTSFLIVSTTFNGEMVDLLDNEVFISYVVKEKRFSQPVQMLNSNGARIINKCYFRGDNSGQIVIEISEDVLQYSGEIQGELIIVNKEKTKRFTSQTLVFKIEPSLTPNDIATPGRFLCGEVICGESKISSEIQENTPSPALESFLNQFYLQNKSKIKDN